MMWHVQRGRNWYLDTTGQWHNVYSTISGSYVSITPLSQWLHKTRLNQYLWSYKGVLL